MIEETATVVAIQGDQVLVQTKRQSTCHSCSVRQGCGTSVLAKVVGRRSSQLSVANTLGAQVGDDVVLGIQEHALVKGSLLVYTLPLLMMLVFALAGEALARAFGWHQELLVILCAVAGFMLSALGIRSGLHNSALKDQIQPHMLRLVSQGTERHDIILAP